MLKRTGACLLTAIILGAGAGAGQKSGVDQLDWMSGCWSSDDGKQQVEECWMKPAGQSMLGTSRTIAGGKTVFTEYVQIREAKGEIAYVVSLGLSARPVSFKLIKNADDEVVFENPTHDFPQRIIYRRESADRLFARIEGQEKGVNKAMDFRYKRSKCD
ncbi:MAG: DUF6265 family protein [Blastocatellia bacterium]